MMSGHGLGDLGTHLRQLGARLYRLEVEQLVGVRKHDAAHELGKGSNRLIGRPLRARDTNEEKHSSNYAHQSHIFASISPRRGRS